MTHFSKPNRPGGFTLIELLVVISIIAMLIAILLPALGKARIAAQMMQSGSQMRQVQMGLLNYTIDYDGKMPYSMEVVNGSRLFWSGLIGPSGQGYVPSVDLFWGPLRLNGYQKYTENMQASPDGSGWVFSGYTANYAGVMPDATDKRKPISVHQGGISASQLVVLFEAYESGALANGYDGWYACNHIYWDNGIFTYDGKAITSYLDGHIETVSSPASSVRTSVRTTPKFCSEVT